jgi:hypothetical protein
MIAQRIVRRIVRLAVIVSAGVTTVAVIACATSTQFDRAIDSHQWPDAATALKTDTTLLGTDAGLFKAAMLYSFPDRSTYDPERAIELFERLLKQYPNSPLRQQANDHLSLLYELQKTSNASTASQQVLQSKIAQLAADTVRLRASIDSIAVQLRAEQDQSGLLRKVATRLESDMQDRDSQLSELHNELNHLKAIDLGPRARGTLGDTAIKKPNNH